VNDVIDIALITKNTIWPEPSKASKVQTEEILKGKSNKKHQ
jgi:hypothetical protein